MIKHIFKLIWNKKRSNGLMMLEIFLSFLVLFFVLAYFFFNTDKVNRPLGFTTVDRWAIYLDNIDQLDSLEGVTTIKNLETSLLAMEEVEAVSFAQSMFPFSGSTWNTGNSDNGFSLNSYVINADLHLKEVLDLNVVEGRWYSEDDLHSAVPTLIVNKEFVDRYYPDKSMIDSIIIFEGERRIIGVVDDYRYHGEFSEVNPTAILLKPSIKNMDAVLLKMQDNVPLTAQERVADITNATTGKPGNTIVDLEESRISDSRESWIILIALLAICGFLCINVALGLFGVLWYNINKRKSEIGLRQALGADKWQISIQFVLEILILTSIAVAVGIFFAIQIPILDVTEYEDGLFYKAILYATGIIVLLVLLCALIPSLQAAKIVPATALHED